MQMEKDLDFDIEKDCKELQNTKPDLKIKKQNYEKWLSVLHMAIKLNGKMNTFKWSKKSKQERFDQMFEPFEALYKTSQSLFLAALEGKLMDLPLVKLMIKCGTDFEKFCKEEEMLQISHLQSIENKLHEIKLKS